MMAALMAEAGTDDVHRRHDADVAAAAGEVESVNKALDARGIPPASVTKMKPWMLSAMVALPACELARKAGGAPVLDVKLAEDAKAAGKIRRRPGNRRRASSRQWPRCRWIST